MITEDVGKLILSTQGDVKRFKDQLLAFAENNMSQEDTTNPNKDVKILYERLQMQIEKFENNLDNKMEFLFKSMVNDNNITVQKFPLINQQVEIPQKTEKPQKIQSALPKSNSMKAELISEPLSRVLYKRKQEKKPKKNSILKNLKSFSEQPNLQSILTAPSYQSSGLISLINQGKITKDVDIGPLLHQDQAILCNKPLKFYQHKDQFKKQTISLSKDLPSTAVLDVNYLKSQTTEDSAIRQTDPQPIYLPKLNRNRQIKEKNLQLEVKPIETPIRSAKFSEKFDKLKDFEELNFKKTSILSYPEVLDTYSLHLFIIRKGRTLIETPEFQSYKRICENIWEPIQNIIKNLEKLLRNYGVPLATIDGKKVARLAVHNKKTTLNMNELLDCVVNSEEVNQVMKIPSLMFKGPKGRDLAIVRIQSFWRMTCAMRDYKRIRVLIEKVRIIQSHFRVYLKYKNTKSIIKDIGNNELKEYYSLSQNFKANWKEIKLGKRVEIHINSYSFEDSKRLTMEKFLQRQNTQIARIFNLRDPLTEIIYVCPFDLPAEIINYYHKVLDLGEIHNFKERLHFVWPENHINFPSHFTTSRLLLYSPKAIKRIRTLIQGKNAFIVPGFPSNDDIKLAVQLKIPIFSGDPQKHFTMSSKSAAKRLFLGCEIPCPPGAYEIYDEKELINSLTILIANNININTWIFKIDDEFNGRGISWFSVNGISFFKELRKVGKFEVTENLLGRIRDLLTQVLPNRMKFATPSLYPNYKEYLLHFVRKGGIIEAMPNAPLSSINSPSISLLIEPDAEITMLTAYEKISGKEYVNVAMSFPQKSLHEINLKAIAQVLGQALYEKGIFGYITVDLISFPDPFSGPETQNVLFWAVGLDCFLNHYTTGFFYFDFLMKGKMDEINGKYHLLPENNERTFIYCPFLHHPGLSNIQYKTFFHMCRIENISFDLERKIGSSFVLLDSLQTGVVGLLAVAENDTETLRFVSEALKFLMLHSGNLSMKYFNNQEISRSDNLHILDIVSRMKLMYKKKLKVLQKIKKNDKNYNSQYL